MTSVRPVRQWEIGELVRLGRLFHAEAALGGNFDATGLAEFLHNMRKLGNLVAFVAEKDDRTITGCIVGIRSKQMMTDVILLEELYWYVEPEHRGGTAGFRLLDAFVKHSKTGPCGGVVMARLSAGHDNLHRYYIRQELQEIETHYLRLWQSPQPSSQ